MLVNLETNTSGVIYRVRQCGFLKIVSRLKPGPGLSGRTIEMVFLKARGHACAFNASSLSRFVAC